MKPVPLLDASPYRDVANSGRDDALTRWSVHTYRGHMPQRSNHPQRPTAWMNYLRGIQNRPGWTIARVARESNNQISRSALFEMMGGKTRRISVDVVRLVATIVGDDPDEVLQQVGGSVVGTTTDPRLEGLDPDDPVVQSIMNLDITETERKIMLDHRRKLVALRMEQDLAELELMIQRSGPPPRSEP